jgi:hypothetical protein
MRFVGLVVLTAVVAAVMIMAAVDVTTITAVASFAVIHHPVAPMVVVIVGQVRP